MQHQFHLLHPLEYSKNHPANIYNPNFEIIGKQPFSHKNLFYINYEIFDDNFSKSKMYTRDIILCSDSKFIEYILNSDFNSELSRKIKNKILEYEKINNI